MTIMDEITFEDYKTAIKKEYAVAKENDILGFLSNLTPAQVRDLCISISNKSLSNNDEIILRAYFGAKENEELKKVIEKFGTGKFKSVISFLKNEKDSENRNRIELAAILVDFKLRPLNNFRKNYKVYQQKINAEVDKIKKPTIFNELLDEKSVNTISEENVIHNSLLKSKKKEPWIQKNKLKFGLLLIGIIIVGIFGFEIFNTNKDCMQWNNDHYEEVSCNSDLNKKIGFYNESPLIKNNQNLIDSFKKIKVCDTTTYFKNGKPCVWYGKSFDGTIECFNMPGFHPETGETLKKITPYIIKKYLK
jgi:hypothetical protein